MAIHEDESSRKRKREMVMITTTITVLISVVKRESRTEVAAATYLLPLIMSRERKINYNCHYLRFRLHHRFPKAMKLMGPSRERETIRSSIDEIKLDNQIFWWDDKYNPRKPKYYNRIHIGYEWSRYNRDVYNKTDQKPPKVVQGYKFNIFYPELICKSRCPTYSIVQDWTRDGETCAIRRFSAGPPYEDIAFRIVNREVLQERRIQV